MLPRLSADLVEFTPKMATSMDASGMAQALAAELREPIKIADEDGNQVWMSSENPLLDPIVADAWTNHSKRAILTSALAAIGVDKVRRDFLGRWSPSGSDDYVRTSRRWSGS